MLPGAQIGVQIGAAKTVDGLLRVAHEKQGGVPGAVDRLEDLELQRVGVLKLVDQSCRKTRLQ